MHVMILSALFAMIANKSGGMQSGEIRIVSVERTPESDTAGLAISVPKPGEVVEGSPIWAQIRVDGYPMGTDSQFDRADELIDSNVGQSAHVVVDNYPYFQVNGPALDPFLNDGWYYDSNYKFKIPFRLQAGKHTLRIFLARSFGESLKGDRCFQSTYFYVGEARDNMNVDLQAPFITYNEPSDQFRWTVGKPVLLDFWVDNCELSSDGYKVKVTIDGTTTRQLSQWVPYYIYGLKAGTHKVRLQLIDGEGKEVAGPFNDVTRTVSVF